MWVKTIIKLPWTLLFLCCKRRNLLYYVVYYIHIRGVFMSSKRILFFIEIAILTALALILDLLPFLTFKLWPAGGSISLAMIPVYLVACRLGIKGGLLFGFLWGILKIGAGVAYII